MKAISWALASFAALFILVSCKPNPAPANEDKRLDFSIVPGERVGLITADACTREAVLAAYGDSAKVDSIHLIEGMMDEGVVLFAGNPRRTAYVYWDKNSDPKRPAFIRIIGDDNGQTDWKTTSGITLGTPIAEVEKQNGKPFNLFGFGWDYGGNVTNWNGGNFNAATNFRFSPTGESVPDSLSGERELRSDQSQMAQAGVVVGTMEFRFLAKEPLPDCIMAKVNASKPEARVIVSKMVINGEPHYWVNDGAAAYDGIEYVYDGNCKEVCKMGGMRQAPECWKAYENGVWEVLFEK